MISRAKTSQLWQYPRHPTNKIRIVHIINNLHVGGAEMMMLKLLSNLDPDLYENCVVSLIDRGPIGERIAQLGIPVIALQCRQQAAYKTFLKLTKIFSNNQPDIIQTWMYHGNLFGGATAKLWYPKTPVIWNIRHSTIDATIDSRSTIIAAKMGAKLSHIIPKKIIINSTAGLKSHIDIGYAPARFQLIPNGFDCDNFRPSTAAKRELRNELGLPPETPLVGMVARFHPHKDHASFIRAAAKVASQCPQVHFVLCGKNITRDNLELWSLIKSSGLEERAHLLGPRTDLPRIQAAIDLAVLTSISEGFPNVLGEALASETPCVTTDVGDGPYLIGDSGWVVPTRNPPAIADAIVEFLQLPDLDKDAIGAKGRKRIIDLFSLKSIVAEFQKTWLDVLVKHSTKRDSAKLSTSTYSHGKLSPSLIYSQQSHPHHETLIN